MSKPKITLYIPLHLLYIHSGFTIELTASRIPTYLKTEAGNGPATLLYWRPPKHEEIRKSCIAALSAHVHAHKHVFSIGCAQRKRYLSYMFLIPEHTRHDRLNDFHYGNVFSSSSQIVCEMSFIQPVTYGP